MNRSYIPIPPDSPWCGGPDTTYSISPVALTRTVRDLIAELAADSTAGPSVAVEPSWH